MTGRKKGVAIQIFNEEPKALFLVMILVKQ